MTGLAAKPTTWDGFFAALEEAEIPDDFLSEQDRNQGSQDRDSFAGWNEEDAKGELPLFGDWPSLE